MSSNSEVRIGCVQTPATATFEEAIEVASRLSGDAVAKGAELVCLPEFCGGLKTDNGMICPPSAPEADHPVVASLRDFARNAGVWTHIGSVAVDGLDSRLINRGFLVDDQGEIRARYDKIHLFDVDLPDGKTSRESERYEAGQTAVLAELPWGGLGMTVCYDLRFPVLYWKLAQAGASFLAVPSAFTRTTGRAHWHALLRARAIETGCYVIAPAQCGDHGGGRESYGHSLVVEPWGEIVADGGEEVGFVLAEIDPARVRAARAALPALRNARRYDPPSSLRAAE